MDHQPWTISHGPSAMDHQPWTTSLGPSALDHQPWTISHGPSPSAMDHQPWTISLGPSAMDRQPWSISFVETTPILSQPIIHKTCIQLVDDWISKQTGNVYSLQQDEQLKGTSTPGCTIPELTLLVLSILLSRLLVFHQLRSFSFSPSGGTSCSGSMTSNL